jgi:hypothetical protein
MTANDRISLIRVKIERAYKHIEDLEDAIRETAGPVFKSVSVEFEPNTGKPRLQSSPLLIYPPEVPAMAGDAVHNLRSALDHLAFHLVEVGISLGETRGSQFKMVDIQFPISYSPDGYKSIKPRSVEGMTREAIEAIDALKPYKGGNDALWLLRQLDNTDKHTSILAVGEDFIMGGVSLKAYNPFFTALDAPQQDQGVNFASQEPLIESAVGRGNALLPTLHQLAHLVSDTVASFRPLLEDGIRESGEASGPPDFLDWLNSQS